MKYLFFLLLLCGCRTSQTTDYGYFFGQEEVLPELRDTNIYVLRAGAGISWADTISWNDTIEIYYESLVFTMISVPNPCPDTIYHRFVSCGVDHGYSYQEVPIKQTGFGTAIFHHDGIEAELYDEDGDPIDKGPILGLWEIVRREGSYVAVNKIY